ncbi:hypothetical protein ACH3XW_27665 [Acanthocheilonema viteae]|uniref:Uncharacterized protein n=1 Tax=Acanthocheilonema viteae TaxID=6277 RepID=A0A498SU13_ACAVI|nr:unnamed protein product [Acanthocheilonema viteae]
MNRSFDANDLEALDMDNPEFENFSETDESGYYSGDHMQEAIDRAFMIGFNETMDRMEQRINEIANENWFRHNINNHNLLRNFRFDLPNNIAPYDLPGGSRQNNNEPYRVVMQQLEQVPHCVFYERVVNEPYPESLRLDRLSAGSSRSWSPNLINQQQERPFTRYRRYSYPVIARDFDFPQTDNELSEDEMDNLSNFLRSALTTRDELPPEGTASDPPQLLAVQQSNSYPMIGGNEYHMRYGSNRSIFSGERSSVRSHYRRHTGHGVKRYHSQRSGSGSSRDSTKRRRSLPPMAGRRISLEYTSSESDAEPVEEVSYTDRNIEQNYLPRLRQNIIYMRTNRRRLSPSQNPRRRRRSSQRYPRVRLYGRLRRVNNGRITRKRS